MMLLRLCLLIITLITERIVSQNPGKITVLNLSAFVKIFFYLKLFKVCCHYFCSYIQVILLT